MTIQQINNMIGEIGLPFAYYQFDEGTGQQPPFICWMIDANDDLYADNRNYQRIGVLIIELYTDTKDFALEAQVEAVLSEFSYTKDSTHLDSERMHETIYTMEVLINGE